MSAAYLISNLSWSLGGFAVGWLVGRIGRGVAEVQAVGGRGLPRWADVLRTLAGLVILVLVVVTTVHTVRTTDCQARLNAEFRAALADRSAAAQAESDAQRDLLTTAPDEGREAVARYLAALDELDKARAAHPLPSESGCGL